MKTSYHKIDNATMIEALKALVRLFKARPALVSRVSQGQMERAMAMLPGIKVDKSGNYLLVPSHSHPGGTHNVVVDRSGQYPATTCSCEYCATNQSEICAHKIIARAVSEAICNPM